MKKTIKTSFLAAGAVVAIAGSASASITLRNGLVNYWNLDNNLVDQAHLNPLTASTNADDGVFAGANGTGGIAYAPGLFGQATSQDGASGGWWDEIIDEVRLSSVYRDDDWYDAEYNNQKPSSTFLDIGAQGTDPSAGGLERNVTKCESNWIGDVKTPS